jgi:hypothetical protein
VRGRLAFLGAAAAALGAVSARLWRRKGPASEPDPRADELRRRLDESRSVVSERDEFEGAETPVDEVEPVADLDERRREIHDRARTTAEEMRRDE